MTCAEYICNYAELVLVLEVLDDGAPPHPSFPFSMNSVDGNHCYQLSVAGYSQCFNYFWTQHSSQYAAFASGDCPVEFNFVQQNGVR